MAFSSFGRIGSGSNRAHEPADSETYDLKLGPGRLGGRSLQWVAPDLSPPDAPSNLVLRHGQLTGVIVTRYRPKRTPSMNEVQVCTSDPNTDANWKTAGMFSGGKASIPGFDPGTTVWVRARTVGLKGVMGAWSESGKIMAV